ncbi:MAG: 50S ribosomal protein L11 methyltransferase [Desulfuromonadales bacterium]|nr:50S ribosomal protein L11 methyltransferase [Desulfuromonadales bacterium]
METTVNCPTYAPFDMGSKFRLVAPGTCPATAGRIDIIMARGAFGSGEHETTASCIDLLEEMDNLSGQTILDLGSGTAILSIVAQKLGARRALCIDIDPKAITSAQHNCQLNGIKEEIEHRCGTLQAVAETGFDLVLANIYGDILLDICADLVKKVRPGGRLLLSGILWEYNFDVRKRYEKAGCELLKNRLLEEFSTVLLRKNPR